MFVSIVGLLMYFSAATAVSIYLATTIIESHKVITMD